MSSLLRQLFATLVLIVLINGSQQTDNDWPEEPLAAAKRGFYIVPVQRGKKEEPYVKTYWFGAPRGKRTDGMVPTVTVPFLRIGKSTETAEEPPKKTNQDDGVADDDNTTIEEVDKRDELEKRLNSHIRIGKRSPGNTWIRIGKREPYNSHIRVGRTGSDSSILRVGRAGPPPTTPKQTWIRIGRRSDDLIDAIAPVPKSTTFIRIGKGSPDEGFLRIGKGVLKPLRLGRRSFGDNSRQYIRLGRSILNANKADQDLDRPLTAEDIQLLKENRERLLQLLMERPDLINMSEDDLESYFAFPRQGRAMSFYFPRMGRSGSDTEIDESTFCCAEGVRRIITVGKGTFEICPRVQSCCNDLNERTKRYKDIVITECAVMAATPVPVGSNSPVSPKTSVSSDAPQDDSLEQIRAYINSE